MKKDRDRRAHVQGDAGQRQVVHPGGRARRPPRRRSPPARTVVLDVREPDEYEQGALPGAVHIPRGHLETSGRGSDPRQVQPTWSSTAPAAPARPSPPRPCSELGYTDVVSVVGGFNRWKDEGRAWVAPRTLTPEQRNRYQRHLLLPEVGEAGQLKLLDSKVLLLGRRRPGLAGRPVPGRGRGRHPRHHRHGRGRRLQPAAPDPAQHGPDRRAQGRLGQEDADRAQPGRRTSSPTTCASGPTTSSTSSTATT